MIYFLRLRGEAQVKVQRPQPAQGQEGGEGAQGEAQGCPQKIIVYKLGVAWRLSFNWAKGN